MLAIACRRVSAWISSGEHFCSVSAALLSFSAVRCRAALSAAASSRSRAASIRGSISPISRSDRSNARCAWSSAASAAVTAASSLDNRPSVRSVVSAAILPTVSARSWRSLSSAVANSVELALSGSSTPNNLPSFGILATTFMGTV